MHNILLESGIHWPSEDAVKFEVDVGFKRNVQKCNRVSYVLVWSQQTVAAR